MWRKETQIKLIKKIIMSDNKNAGNPSLAIDRSDSVDIFIIKHEEKQKMALNRNHLGLFLNFLILGGIIYTMASYRWFRLK